MAGRGRAVGGASGASVVATVLAWLAACASPGPRPPVQDAAPVSIAETSSEIRQGLFRVRYRGVDGRGRVRLTLRSAAERHFTLTAVDTFGRRLWSFEKVDDGSLLLDHRAREYCHLAGDLVFRAVALSELPVIMLPRVLFGELPSPPPPGVELPQRGEIEFLGSDGRRWSTRLDSGRVASWTLWRDGEPLVWWLREESGGILSHRDGAQARWTEVAAESYVGALEPLTLPPDYSLGRCDADVS